VGSEAIGAAGQATGRVFAPQGSLNSHFLHATGSQPANAALTQLGTGNATLLGSFEPDAHAPPKSSSSPAAAATRIAGAAEDVAAATVARQLRRTSRFDGSQDQQIGDSGPVMVHGKLMD
tara:strand:- start:1630 stop:1989 length:360 start_codon:yes stop_codon:yes gene_type:complete